MMYYTYVLRSPVRDRLPAVTANSNGGYIALISVVIISVLLMTVAFTLSFSGFLNRFTILDSEFKEVSNGLAEACVDMAILKIAENPAYSEGEDINVGSEECRIVSVASTTAAYEIKASSIFKNSYTNLFVTATSTGSDINILSWEELANF